MGYDSKSFKTDKDAEIERLNWVQRDLVSQNTHLYAYTADLQASYRGASDDLEHLEKENSALLAEIERLKAKDIIQFTKIGMRAIEIKGLKDQLLAATEVRDEEFKLTDTLRARFEEAYAMAEEYQSLGAYSHAKIQSLIEAFAEERDELREKLATMELQRDNLRTELYRQTQRNDSIEREIKTWSEPKQPTIVKQTWTSVSYDHDSPKNIRTGNRQEYRVADMLVGQTIFGHIRHDHYSDGTVVCELEKV